MSGINPNPETPVSEGDLSYQNSSPLLVVKQREIWAEIDQPVF